MLMLPILLAELPAHDDLLVKWFEQHNQHEEQNSCCCYSKCEKVWHKGPSSQSSMTAESLGIWLLASKCLMFPCTNTNFTPAYVIYHICRQKLPHWFAIAMVPYYSYANNILLCFPLFQSLTLISHQWHNASSGMPFTDFFL